MRMKYCDTTPRNKDQEATHGRSLEDSCSSRQIPFRGSFSPFRIACQGQLQGRQPRSFSPTRPGRKRQNTKGNVQFFSCCIQLHTSRSIVIEYITTAQLLQDPPDHIISVLQTTIDIVADRIVEEGAL